MPDGLTKKVRREAEERLHLPSVHVERADGSGFDFEVNLYIRGRGFKRRVWRLVRFAAWAPGGQTLVRETRDKVCGEELRAIEQNLPALMDESNPGAKAWMEEWARMEYARQRRIATGQEKACAGCGCSESRSCSGGCIWVTQNLCSRCA